MTTDEGQIAGVEAAISGAEEPAAIDSEGVSLVDSQLRASEENVLVRGEARNTSESELRYVQATAKVYDGDEQLLTTAYTNKTDLAARATWRFEMEPRTVGRNGDVESADVLLTTSTF